MQVHKNFPLKEVLWYKIGGTARFMLDCKSPEDILEALDFVDKNNPSRVFFLGLGSNLIFTDEFFDGVVIRMASDKNSTISVKGDVIQAYAGEILGDVIEQAFENNLVGIEWAGGLPGTVGAGVRGNVGAFGGEIKDSFYKANVAVITQKGSKVRVDTKEMDRREIKFAYRNSTVKRAKNMIVLSSAFKLTKADSAKVGRAKQTYYSNIEYRKEKHPLELPNCGSVFKNVHSADQIQSVLEIFPDIEQKVRVDWHGKVSMGYLVKRLDLSGYRVGNAQVSTKHSNFIVNLGDATFSDVMTIIKKIQDTFEDHFGFAPEPEVEIVY